MDITKKIWLNLFARKRFHKFNARLLRRGLAGLGVNDFGPRQERGERHVLERLLGVLPPRAIVCDVGAHDGSYSLFLAGRRPDLVIHAFEPNPVTYARLADSAKGKFTAHQFALGDQEGDALLHDPGAEAGSTCASLIGAAVDALYKDQPRRTMMVPVKRLDRVAQSLQLGGIHYLKIDAEGFDLIILRGASALIEVDRLDFVQFEFNKMNVFSRTFMHDFYQILPHHRLHRIVQDGLIDLGPYNPASWELFGFQNIVAIPQRMLGRI